MHRSRYRRFALFHDRSVTKTLPFLLGEALHAPYTGKQRLAKKHKLFRQQSEADLKAWEEASHREAKDRSLQIRRDRDVLQDELAFAKQKRDLDRENR